MTDPQPDADPVEPRRELVVVMPVYNEQDSLGPCVESWLDELDRLGIDHELLVLNDGSTDDTATVLADLGGHPRVTAVSKANEGHGPTILRGYRDAVGRAEWVFQVDSDDEIPASAFATVWAARTGHDAVFGIRTERVQSIDRRIISIVAAATTRLLFGARVRDANVPFRLMRAEALGRALAAIPDDTFAPNVAIAGALGRDRTRFAQVEVPHHHRRAGEVSIAGLKATKAAARSFAQTLRLAPRMRSVRL